MIDSELERQANGRHVIRYKLNRYPGPAGTTSGKLELETLMTSQSRCSSKAIVQTDEMLRKCSEMAHLELRSGLAADLVLHRCPAETNSGTFAQNRNASVWIREHANAVEQLRPETVMAMRASFQRPHPFKASLP